VALRGTRRDNVETRDLMQSNHILYLSRNDLLAVGLLDYAAIIDNLLVTRYTIPMSLA
jgi:hypothetical protein